MITEIISTSESFLELRIEWENILDNSSCNNPFLSHQWLKTWWEIYGHGKLHIITCRNTSTNELVGIFPLFSSKLSRFFPVITLRFLGSSYVSSDFLTCIARIGWEQIVYKSCFDFLQNIHNSWDVLLLQDVDRDSTFYKFFMDSNISKFETFVDSEKACPYLTLPESWEYLLKGLSKKTRNKIGYYRRALEKIGKVGLEKITDSTLLHQGLFDVIRLRQDRMEQKGLSASKVNSKYIKFHKLLLPNILSCNRLLLYFLTFNGQRIAYLYLLKGSDSIYFYQTGFNRDWSRYSVGFVLLSLVIENSINEGFTVFEFLRGKEPYKYDWGDVRERHLVDVAITGKSISGNIWRLSKKSISNIRCQFF